MWCVTEWRVEWQPGTIHFFLSCLIGRACIFRIYNTSANIYLFAKHVHYCEQNENKQETAKMADDLTKADYFKLT